jgi:hypothetical protein
MIFTTALFLTLISIDPKSKDETTLKMEGTSGIRIFGFCVSTDKAEERKFDGVTPAEVHFDTTIQSCKISSEGKESPVKFRVFQNRNFVTERELHAPVSGLEIVIPLSKKKK